MRTRKMIVLDNSVAGVCYITFIILIVLSVALLKIHEPALALFWIGNAALVSMFGNTLSYCEYYAKKEEYPFKSATHEALDTIFDSLLLRSNYSGYMLLRNMVMYLKKLFITVSTVVILMIVFY